MKTSAITTLAIIGCVSADTHTASLSHTSDHGASAGSVGAGSFAQASQVAPVQDNSLYYNNYATDPYNGGYYDYSDQSLFDPSATAEVDRQDPLTAGLTATALLPIVTIFAAALAGALSAPAFSAAGRALFDMFAEIPNIEINLPGAEIEENEVRSFQSSDVWSRMLTNVVTNLSDEFNSRYKGKFAKLLSNKL